MILVLDPCYNEPYYDESRDMGVTRQEADSTMGYTP